MINLKIRRYTKYKLWVYELTKNNHKAGEDCLFHFNDNNICKTPDNISSLKLFRILEKYD